jgi:hypothetical protein
MVINGVPRSFLRDLLLLLQSVIVVAAVAGVVDDVV